MVWDGDNRGRESEMTREEAVRRWKKRIAEEKRPPIFFGEAASAKRRTAAVAIDLTVVYLVCVALFAATYRGDYDGFAVDLLLLPVAVVLLLLYDWLFIALKGQTPGKMLCRIKVVNEAGEKPRPMQALRREVVGKFFALVLYGLMGAASGWFGPSDKDTQGILAHYDDFTGTEVIRQPARRIERPSS